MPARNGGAGAGMFGQLLSGQLSHPVVDEVRRKVNAWRDPRARALRARRRAVRSTTTWGGVTALSGGGAALEFASAHPGVLGYGLCVFGAATLAGTLSAARRARVLYRTPLPAPARARVPVPPPGSAAHEPMRRLRAAEDTLDELLEQLRHPAGAVPAVPPDSVRATEHAAAEAGEHLHGLARRLRAVERGREAAAPTDRPGLDDSVDTLRGRLETGVDEYSRLVAAAARAVAASAAQPSSRAVTEATDELTGLASALTELSAGDTH